MSSILDIFNSNKRQNSITSSVSSNSLNKIVSPLTNTTNHQVQNSRTNTTNIQIAQSPSINSNLSSTPSSKSLKSTTNPILINQNDYQQPKLKLNAAITTAQTLFLSNNNNSNNNNIKLRLLVFVEDSDGCRSNIFDSSKYIHSKTSSTNSQTTPNNSNLSSSSNNTTINSTTACGGGVGGGCATLNSPSSPSTSKALNTEMITRMVFGSFPMLVSTRTAIKVHSLKNSQKTMISNVFTYYNTNNPIRQQSSNCSCNIKYHRRQSVQSDNIINHPTNKRLLIKKESSIDNNNSYNTDYSTSKNIKIPSIDSSQAVTTSSSYQSNCLYINTNTNTNVNKNTTNSNKSRSPCSSVPTHGSYTGMYRRLMRSLSNSLISSTIQSSNNLLGSPTSNNNLNESITTTTHFDSINSNDNDSIDELSHNNQEKQSIYHQTSVCDKCIENNCYPKYKIGIALIYYIPKLSIASQNSTSSGSSLSRQSSVSTPSTPLLANNNTINSSPKESPPSNTKITKNYTFDPLVLFPSTSPSSPVTPQPNIVTSPPNNSTLNESLNLINNSSIDDFFEFFFSHLPIIEYQFKELREKSIELLPLYFSKPQISHHNHSSNHNHFNRNRYSLSNSYSSSGYSTASSNLNHINFIQLMLQLHQDFENKFNLLYYSPRLHSPAWLSIINSKKFTKDIYSTLQPNTSLVCSNIINDFVYINKILTQQPANSNIMNKKRLIINNIISTFSPTSTFLSESASSMIEDTLKKNTFLSKLLSTILKYHLSWVYTVLPASFSQNNLNKSKLRKNYANWTSILEKTNPYNPLWAQLSDLHGAINEPLRLVRTVIVGQNKELIEHILYLLSYFIRCGNSSYYDIMMHEQDSNMDNLDLLLSNKKSLVNLNINNNTTTSSSSSSSSTKSTKLILNLNQQQNENINIKTSSSLVPFMFSPTSTTSFTSSPSSNSSTSSESTTNENHNSNSTSSNAKELPLIGSQIKPNLTKSTRHQDNFGYSLLASYCEKFVFEYVLHGTSDRSFLNDLHQRLVFSKQNSILDSKIDESMYIVVDVDSFDIMVYSSENTEYHQVENSIKMVDDMVKSALNMIKLFQNSEFVLLHLEDLLQEFYIKSITLNQLMSSYSDEKTIMELMEYVLLLIF